MKPLKFIFSSLLLVLFAASCKNDLKLNAPYKEIPSIYAVLSAQENVHMVRINKVFLGEGDANVMAKVADSINYPAGELTVTLERFESGSDYKTQLDACPTCPANSPNRRTITFHDSVITADPGAFSTTQRVYVAYEDLHQEKPRISATTSLNINANWKVYGDYKLTVKNNRTGNVFTAKSSIIDSVHITNMMPFRAPFYPYKGLGYAEDNFVDYTQDEKTYSIRINPNEGFVYQTIVRFHFMDYPWYYERTVDYEGTNLNMTDNKITNNAGSYLQTDFRGKDIYNAIGAGLKKQGLDDQLDGRKMLLAEYMIYSSSQDYYDYIQFVKPSLNIAQNKPLYSNFENRDALGIFTFRSRCRVQKEMTPAYITSFSNNSNTCRYKFKTYDDRYLGCQ